MTHFEEAKQAIESLNRKEKTLKIKLKEIQKQLEEIALTKKECIAIILDSFN